VFTEDVPAISVMMIEDISVITDPDYMIPYANFFQIQDPCSFETLVYFGSSMPFGSWRYEINGSQFATTRNATVSVCEPGNYNITAYVSTSASSSSCGTVAIPASTDDYTDGITVVEYRPNFSVSTDWGCCPVKEETYSLSLASFNWNNTVTGCTTANLTYTIYSPGGTSVATATYGYADLVGAPIPLTDVNIAFTPNDLGTYKLVVEAENCCTTITEEFEYEICNSWVVSNTTCNILKIENLSSSVPLTYTIKKLNDDNVFEVATVNDVVLQDLDLAFGNSVSYDMGDDNLYTVTISQENDDPRVDNTDLEYIILLDCNIRKCKKELLRLFLCEDDVDCGCAINDLTEFTALSNILYRKWNIWKQQQSIYTTLDINDIVDDIATLSIAITKIKEICKECANDNLSKGDDCGCN
jgi:hypothetical protein